MESRGEDQDSLGATRDKVLYRWSVAVGARPWDTDGFRKRGDPSAEIAGAKSEKQRVFPGALDARGGATPRK